MLGPVLGFDPFGPSTWSCWVKIHGTHNAPIFSSGSSFFSVGQIVCFFLFLAIIGNGEALMLSCSNTHVSGEYTIYDVAFSTAFRFSPWFVVSIKGCKVLGFCLID